MSAKAPAISLSELLSARDSESEESWIKERVPLKGESYNSLFQTVGELRGCTRPY